MGPQLPLTQRQRGRKQQAQRPQPQEHQPQTGLGNEPALTQAMPAVDQAERMDGDRGQRAPGRAQRVEHPVGDGRHPIGQGELGELQHVRQGRHRQEGQRHRPQGSTPTAQVRQTQNQTQGQVAEDVAHQIVGHLMAVLGQEPGKAVRVWPLPPRQRVQGGIHHQGHSHPGQGPGRTAVLRQGRPAHARPPAQPTMGLKTTRMTMAANSNTDASLKTRYQRWVRRLCRSSNVRSRRRQMWW